MMAGTDNVLTEMEQKELQRFLKNPDAWIPVLPAQSPFSYQAILELEKKGYVRRVYNPNPNIQYFKLILE